MESVSIPGSCDPVIFIGEKDRDENTVHNAHAHGHGNPELFLLVHSEPL